MLVATGRVRKNDFDRRRSSGDRQRIGQSPGGSRDPTISANRRQENGQNYVEYFYRVLRTTGNARVPFALQTRSHLHHVDRADNAIVTVIVIVIKLLRYIMYIFFYF